MTIPAHFRRILAATGAATALALGASAGVAAADQATGTADGVFHYFSAVAGQQVIADPAEGVCMDSPGEALVTPVHNYTDETAVVFAFPGCTGPAYFIAPGDTVWAPFDFASVVFVPTQ